MPGDAEGCFFDEPAVFAGDDVGRHVGLDAGNADRRDDVAGVVINGRGHAADPGLVLQIVDRIAGFADFFDFGHELGEIGDGFGGQSRHALGCEHFLQLVAAEFGDQTLAVGRGVDEVVGAYAGGEFDVAIPGRVNAE